MYINRTNRKSKLKVTIGEKERNGLLLMSMGNSIYCRYYTQEGKIKIQKETGDPNTQGNSAYTVYLRIDYDNMVSGTSHFPENQEE